MLDGSHFIECRCGSDEHTIRFTLSIEDDDPEIYTSVFLNHWQPWYYRIWHAIKYIFGYKCKYGDWDCTLMGETEVDQLQKMIDDFRSQVIIARAKRENTTLENPTNTTT